MTVLILIIALVGLLIFVAWLAPKPQPQHLWKPKEFSPDDITGLTTWLMANEDGHLYDMLAHPPRRISETNDTENGYLVLADR